jgi:hypothetical protein
MKDENASSQNQMNTNVKLNLLSVASINKKRLFEPYYYMSATYLYLRHLYSCYKFIDISFKNNISKFDNLSRN